MDDEAPVARYEPAAGRLHLRLTGGEEVIVTGLGPDLPLWRVDGAGEPAGALWLSATQADVLAKMIDYVLGRVKISTTAQQALQELAPAVAQLRDELTLLTNTQGPGDDNPSADSA